MDFSASETLTLEYILNLLNFEDIGQVVIWFYK